MNEDWLRDHRYEIAIGVFILSVIFLLVIPLLGYLRGLWSSTVSRLLISGIGGLGTILLALLTFLTLLDNHVLVKERVKEREKPLQRDMLEKIVWPAIDSIAANKRKLSDREIDWTAADPEGSFEFVNVDLEMISERGDPVTSDRFVEEYPEAVKYMEEYDEKLAKLDQSIYEFMECTREPLLEYIHSEDISVEKVNPVFGSGSVEDSNVDIDKVFQLIFSGEEPLLDEDRPDWWQNHKEEIYRIVSENDEGYYKKFRSLRTEVFNYSNEVRAVLVEVREEIETEYGISRHQDEIQ